jgi:hypothetical protein
MKRLLLISVLLTLTATPAPAAERKLWATVNICDTALHPNVIGIRAAVPKRSARVLMRFRVQYRDGEGRWRWVRSASSGWRKAPRARESGWSFEVAGGGTQILRGVVNYDFLRHGRVVRHVRRVTEVGHPSTVGADPADFSAATCRIV